MTPARAVQGDIVVIRLGRVDWWKSGYDNTWHAFSADQRRGPNHAFLTAVCEHCVPVHLVTPDTPASAAALCPVCVLTLGLQLPDNTRWRPD